MKRKTLLLLPVLVAALCCAGTLIARAPANADWDGKADDPMSIQQRDNQEARQTGKLETLLMANKTTGQMENKKEQQVNNKEVQQTENREAIKLARALRRKGISDKRVLTAIENVPRHLFIDEEAVGIRLLGPCPCPSKRDKPSHNPTR
jgi:hypothetical protein